MDGPRAIYALLLRNFLSFDENSDALDLQPLNVLIGPNGSGKSNLIEALSVLRSAPTDISVPFRDGGGVREWIWKGQKRFPAASIQVASNSQFTQVDVRHELVLVDDFFQVAVANERICNAVRPPDTPEVLYFGYDNGQAKMLVGGEIRNIPPNEINRYQSVLAQRKDLSLYPELTLLGYMYASIVIYRDWSFGRFSPFKLPQRADLPNIYLSDDGSNLPLVINRLQMDGTTRSRLREYVELIYDGVRDVGVRIEAGTVQLYLQEDKFSIPASRLSDGTLRWIALLAILLHPSPPPLVCIEEPEIGLHPDMFPTLAELLRDASSRMQLIVTTHSSTLVDLFTDTPEAVVVCEKQDGTTRLRRLESSDLGEWLERYSLGQLWASGELGGNRW